MGFTHTANVKMAQNYFLILNHWVYIRQWVSFMYSMLYENGFLCNSENREQLPKVYITSAATLNCSQQSAYTLCYALFCFIYKIWKDIHDGILVRHKGVDTGGHWIREDLISKFGWGRPRPLPDIRDCVKFLHNGDGSDDETEIQRKNELNSFRESDRCLYLT